LRVDDARRQDPPADDPKLVAGLDDLARELTTDNGEAAPPVPPQPQQSDLSPTGAPHRPLLELFPPAPKRKRRSEAAAAAPTTAPAPLPPAAASAREPLPYETFYGLPESPFATTSDPRFFYPAISHDHVLNAMLEAIHEREGLIVVTGPDGLGKSTICRVASRDLDRRTVQSLLLQPPQSIDEVLQKLLVDFGVVSAGDLLRAPEITREAMTKTLSSFLKSLVSLHANAVLMIDDAHNMPADVLAEIAAVFAALESPRMLQVVLVGDPALTAMLARAGVRGVDKRKGVRLELQPFGADEIAPYVRHRLQLVDPRTRLEFSSGAYRRLHALSGGVPRDVNRLCEGALIDGARNTAEAIDTALIDRAAGEVGADAAVGTPRTNARRAILLAVLALLGAAGAVWVFSDAARQAVTGWLGLP
jgi:general secretion pathway protein A